MKVSLQQRPEHSNRVHMMALEDGHVGRRVSVTREVLDDDVLERN